MKARPHILFVCGKNKWRSPTAERIYKSDNRVDVRSAGMSSKSNHPISKADIAWADLILVMERKYKTRLQGMFCGLALPDTESLDIPDEYKYMDEELVALIEESVEYFIEKFEH